MSPSSLDFRRIFFALLSASFVLLTSIAEPCRRAASWSSRADVRLAGGGSGASDEPVSGATPSAGFSSVGFTSAVVDMQLVGETGPNGQEKTSRSLQPKLVPVWRAPDC